jgi:hypothetical protein
MNFSGKKDKMARDLTIKQKKFVQEYLKTENMSEAVRRVYGYKNPGAVRGMVSKIGESRRVKEAIMQELEGVLGSVEAKRELAEKVIKKIRARFEDCQTDRDADKLGRTLLEVTGAIGVGTKIGIGINNFPSSCEVCPNERTFKISDDVIKDIPPMEYTCPACGKKFVP